MHPIPTHVQRLIKEAEAISPEMRDLVVQAYIHGIQDSVNALSRIATDVSRKTEKL